jgi:hypothetical protein
LHDRRLGLVGFLDARGEGPGDRFLISRGGRLRRLCDSPVYERRLRFADCAEAACSISVSLASITIGLTVLRLMRETRRVTLQLRATAYSIAMIVFRNWIARAILEADEGCSTVEEPGEFLDLALIWFA